MYQTQWKHPPYLYCRSTLRILNKAWYMSSSSVNYTAIRKQHFSLYGPIHSFSTLLVTELSASGLLLLLSLSSLIHVLWSPNMCFTGARRGRTTEAAERGELALWDKLWLFPAAGEGLYHRLPAACEATSFQINYNSHTVCLLRTAAPMPGDVIRGDPSLRVRFYNLFAK